jgi:hypothetical protein
VRIEITANVWVVGVIATVLEVVDRVRTRVSASRGGLTVREAVWLGL